ncbi:MAG: fatty acyl-AMP ligase [Candidatus Sericytochromatia bacterium]|nr:fatty acyl-AMP ligase [Candidatus Sericytochromatia bacterium]
MTVTLLDGWLKHVEAAPEALAVSRLDPQAVPAQSLTRGALHHAAQQGAQRLAGLIAPGDRVVLAHAPGLGFVTSVLAVWLAGGIVVTASPPTSDRTRDWLVAIIRESEPRLLLTDTPIVPLLAPLGQALQVPVASLETLPEHGAETNRRPAELAVVQFTSGSTSAPRGVRVSHANLLANLQQLAEASQFGADDVCVTWLPHYHNMGLVGVLLLPLWIGFPVHLMSPLEFLERPGRWLQAISRVGATFSGGPNFAFDLATIRTSAAEAEGLDLSRWVGAFSGSEPVRASTLARFAKRFAPHGFDPRAFYPCYGMAEATVLVTGGAKMSGARTHHFDAEELGAGRALAVPADHPRARALMGLGRTWGNLQLAIVHPETGTRLAAGQVGEVWLRGDSIAEGYWKPATASHPFGHRLEGSDGWLRTGDTGVLVEGDLVLTGRIKELIILNGRNLYPGDLEQALECLRPTLQTAVAFAVEAQRGERLVIVGEVDPDLDDAGRTALLEGIRLALRQEDVTPHDVVLVPPGAIERTATGKLSRFATRDAYVAGRLPRPAEPLPH